ncbi:polyphosphate kinase 2 family protein [Sphingosinicella terrae]|uniref:polyphosphate kinase 2 family protein n=1 Tax=Sphingosinicella terrae TaxID=2172047 RepID=UPI000E0DCC31|nr:polyphosphate kinase [Sphingosinicella terrae]
MPINLWDYEAGDSYGGDYRKDLKDLQEEVSRLFVANHVHGRRAIVVVEGWDASGKGGAIQRLTAECDPRSYRVWPITAPTEEEKARHYLWRFWQRLPRAGEIAIFDRSWYGRVLVERVEGFATDAEWRRAYDEINEFEAQLAADGALIVKLFFHVTQQTQDARFRARLAHPWKRWKVTEEDLRNRGRRKAYLDALRDMFDRTDTRWAPWSLVDGNDKKAARMAALRHVADALGAALPAEPPPIRPEMEQVAAELLQGRD